MHLLDKQKTETGNQVRPQTFFGRNVVFPKLTINAPNDKFEQEADAMADRVMRMSEGAPLTVASGSEDPTIQRACAACEKEDKEHLQRSVDSDQENTLMMKADGSGQVATPALQQQLQQTKGGGQPLAPAIQRRMGDAFGSDFSTVRVHIGADAATMNTGIQARAFTHGSDIYFNRGQFRPGSAAGDHLLAHELTHVVQQRGNRVGSPDGHPPQIQKAEGDMTPYPDRATPQLRGGPARRASIQLANSGDDEVYARIIRYLCDCQGRNVSESSVRLRTRPSPGITYRFCRGRTTLRVEGSVNPSSFTTGSATVGADLNIASQGGSPGARIRVEAEGRNTGTEPQVGGRVSGRFRLPRAPEFGVDAEVFGGTQTGRIDSRIGAGVDIGGGVNLGGQVTNPHDRGRIGVGVTLGGNLPGQQVESNICRECVCPVVYHCYRDTPPRAYDEEVTRTVTETSPLRYYFRLNSTSDTGDASLRQASQEMLTTVAQRVTAGATISSISGYASPEFMSLNIPAGEKANEDLSLRRAVRLRQLLASRLGASVSLPEAEVGGELLGRRPTILLGSELSQAIIDAGFSGPEEVSTLLVGNEIENDQLSDQFLGLFNRVTSPDDRLTLFGIAPGSQIAPELLAAIDQFVASGGRGRTPWRRVFEYLRFATVELTETRQETSTEIRHTRGDLSRMGEYPCNDLARQAEDNNLFGPAEEEPERSDCPVDLPHNDPDFDRECDYTI